MSLVQLQKVKNSYVISNKIKIKYGIMDGYVMFMVSVILSLETEVIKHFKTRRYWYFEFYLTTWDKEIINSIEKK